MLGRRLGRVSLREQTPKEQKAGKKKSNKFVHADSITHKNII